MSERLARQRWWISCLYGLAVVLVQGFHVHHAPKSVGEPFASRSTCGDDHPEARDHEGSASTFSSCVADCPSCDFLLSHQAALADRDATPEVARFSLLSSTDPADPDTAPVRPRSRAPPLS